MMDHILMLQWLGNILIVAGLWGIGSRRRGAFCFSIAGEGAWVIAAVEGRNWALAFICVVFMIMAARGFILWGESDKR